MNECPVCAEIKKRAKERHKVYEAAIKANHANLEKYMEVGNWLMVAASARNTDLYSQVTRELGWILGSGEEEDGEK